MKKTRASFLLMIAIPLIVPGVVFAMDSAGMVSNPTTGLNALQSNNAQMLLAQAGISTKPALSDTDKKMLESQLQKFQGDYQKAKSSRSAQSLTDSLQQGNLNANPNLRRLNQSPTNRDRLVQ